MPPRRRTSQPMLIAGAPTSASSSRSPSASPSRALSPVVRTSGRTRGRSRARSPSEGKEESGFHSRSCCPSRSRSRSPVRLTDDDRLLMHSRVVAAITRCSNAVHLYAQQQQEQQRRETIRHWINVVLLVLLFAQLCWVVSSPPFVL